MDFRAFRDYVNTTLNINDEYKRIFGKPIPTGKFFCPFHVNTNTPAAKQYYNGIKCFSCNRFYTVFDLLQTFDPNRLNELKGASVIEPVKRTEQQRRVRIVRYDPSDGIKNILTKILTENGISEIQ